MLATNNIIEKIFLFLWFWLGFLLITSAYSFIYFAVLMFAPSHRLRMYFLSFAIRIRVKLSICKIIPVT